MKFVFKKAFSLIELVVVIGIIALLLSVVLPALNQAKEAGRAVVCRSLARQYSLGIYAYFLETGGLLPISVNDPIMRPWHTFDEFRSQIQLNALSQEHKDRRMGQLQEYKPGYEKKFICPAAKYALNHPEDALYPIDRSYGLNAHVYYFKGYVKRRLESQSARILCMGDAMDWWFNYWECDNYDTYGEQWLGYDTYGSAAFRHNKKANVSYWDGHVDQMTTEELKEHLKMWLTLDRRY